ncbi:DeoR/GlpR family DNA-binding transcription regulator [Paracoccus sp. PAMC 22219]|uniref:DeoR/GlpR family DNA-binding transcription regulator n=1 Tax=Paracoccus sp. PAMC 22219 TaxID=1569209 RepID=UPI0005A9B729|nr:DeoR/GlpR family DNA-binding transcription regulator [Paracoccus sp. PAMC 22219]
MDMISSDSRQARLQARRQLIAQAVMAEGSLRIEDLTDRFGISLMTAHRDLDELAARGLLRKSRGIASAAPTSLIEASDLYRDTRQGPQKSAIAQLAAQQVEPGQAVFLDDSTTVLRMVPHLAARVPLTVITNSLTLMTAIKEIGDMTLLGLGGQFHHWCNAFMGPQTTAQIRRLRADVAILSMAAITDAQVFHQSPEMAETKRAMMDAASRRILLADHTKFTRRALHSMGGIEDFDLIITDDRTPPDQITALRQRGVAVQIAATGD